MTHLKFEETGKSASGTTKLWAVKSAHSGDSLGAVRWYAPWRKYTFFPTAGTTFDPACLSEVMSFLI